MADPTDTTTPTVNATGTTPTTPVTSAVGTTANTTNTSSTTATTPAAEGTLSTAAGQLTGTTLTPTQMAAIQNTNISNATNPQLPSSATATPVMQQVQPGEMMNYNPINTNADQVNSNLGVNASTVGGVATAANPTTGMTAATYNAAVLDPAQVASATQAVTAALPADALVSNQLQQLLTPDANGNLPSWIQPAVTAANQFLTGRGISNSTMAGQAITSAILTAAIPVATANANAELTAFQQNLSNEQQAALQYGQEFTNVALSNQGAVNAAQNFNATSENQTNQFLGNIATQINQFNAQQYNAINQFNASQTQTAATNTAQLQSQLQEFNANMANQREQFNTQNAIIVQQANAEYLRSVNTANTAVQNQDNQLNAQNSLNLSDAAMANLQQQFNDEATMLYNSNMTAEQQNYSIAYLSQQYGLQNKLDQNVTDMLTGVQLNQQIGTLASNLFSPVVSSAGNALGNAISSVFSSGTSNSGSDNLTNSGSTTGATSVGGETNPLDIVNQGDITGSINNPLDTTGDSGGFESGDLGGG